MVWHGIHKNMYRYVAVDFSQRPIPKVLVSDKASADCPLCGCCTPSGYKDWIEITDPQQVHELLKDKTDYQKYLKEEAAAAAAAAKE